MSILVLEGPEYPADDPLRLERAWNKLMERDGGEILIPAGTHMLGKTVLRISTSYRSVNIRGIGFPTLICSEGIEVLGTPDIQYPYFTFENFQMYGGGAHTVGLKLTNVLMSEVRNVQVNRYDIGVRTEGYLVSGLIRVHADQCRVGFEFDESPTGVYSNNLKLERLRGKGCELAVRIVKGDGFLFDTCDIETCLVGLKVEPNERRDTAIKWLNGWMEDVGRGVDQVGGSLDIDTSRFAANGYNFRDAEWHITATDMKRLSFSGVSNFTGTARIRVQNVKQLLGENAYEDLLVFA